MNYIYEHTTERLKKHWDYAINYGIAEEQILGIFVYGSQNYNFASCDSDVDSILIYIPTFEEFCLKHEWVSKELHCEDEHIQIKDIREMRKMLMKQNINYLEILYTEYFILNPKYNNLWKTYFVDNREVIVHYDRARIVESISGRLSHMLYSDLKDNKKLYNAYRLYYFLENYLNNKVYLDCIHLDKSKHDFLWNLKYGLSQFSQDAEAKVQSAKELEQKLYDLVSMYPNLDSPLSEKAATILNEGTIEILKYSFAAPRDEATKEQFLKSLTNGENKAYYSIIKEIGNEGNISITKLIEKNCISRPVYNNLIIKMKEQKIANIVSQGMKGTHIEIIQPELRAEAIKYK